MWYRIPGRTWPVRTSLVVVLVGDNGGVWLSRDINVTPTRSPVQLFTLIVVLSVPFWLLGALVKTVLVAQLPISSLMAVCPLVAAFILTYRAEGSAGVRRWFSRVIERPARGRGWWFLPAIVTMPVITLGVYGVRALTRRPLPAPTVTPVALVLYTLAFLIAATCEEMGWSAYAVDPLQDRWDAIRASLLIGSVWAGWHIIPWLQVRTLPWVAWQCLFTVAARVLIVWIYNGAGRSVPVAIIFHTMINICYAIWAGAYAPMPVTMLTTVAIVAVAAFDLGRRHHQCGK